MSNGDNCNEEKSFVEFRRKVRSAEVLSAAMERLLLSLQFTGRVCVVVQNGRVLRQEILVESILAGTTVVAMGAGVSSMIRKSKEKAKGTEQSGGEKKHRRRQPRRRQHSRHHHRHPKTNSRSTWPR
jgi:hypothetical protein